MKTRDLVIIGGGSAGMAAAIQAYNDGIKDILIIEKDHKLGGILNQCIHNGFGLTEFKEELTGPEYLTRFATKISELGIEVKLDTTVLGIDKDLAVTYSNRIDGYVALKAKAIILATGCYERSAGAIQIPGDRPSGIITAGTAQKFLNIDGYLVGKRIVILGSGDIGLIMARRMTLEGAKVLCVAEIMPYSNGLNRNIAQCLNDFDIPLYLSHSVSKVIGNKRVEKVIISQVDDKFQFIPGTEKEFDCDTLLLSVGLIPNVGLLSDVNCPIGSTKGAIVNENMETMIPGLFTCGNCLHVHDLVDFVSEEGRSAGHGAALYIKDGEKVSRRVTTHNGENVGYVIPEIIDLDTKDMTTLKFRVKKPIKDVYIIVESSGNIIKKVMKPVLIPSEMEMIKIPSDVINGLKDDITVRIERRIVEK